MKLVKLGLGISATLRVFHWRVGTAVSAGRFSGSRVVPNAFLAVPGWNATHTERFSCFPVDSEPGAGVTPLHREGRSSPLYPAYSSPGGVARCLHSMVFNPAVQVKTGHKRFKTGPGFWAFVVRR
jgi:hypothetical protein